MNEESIFAEAIAKHAKDRRLYLDRACNGDAELRARVEALLQAHDNPDSIFDHPVAPLANMGSSDSAPKTLGDFEILREIGRGGMGIVYEARQKSLNRRVALKVLSSGLGLTAKAVLRFRREAEAAARLHHTNITPIYATGEESGVHYYAMELIEGPSLDRVIRQLKIEKKAASHESHGADSDDNSQDIDPEGIEDSSDLPGWVRETMVYSGGKSPKTSAPEAGAAGLGDSSGISSGKGYFDAVANMVAQVADALEHAHDQGVIHRDIKPSNLLLSPDGRLTVTDFGLARILEQPGMTMTGEFVGSPLYMSPEQITAGKAPLDHRTDIYSLGATLYELLTLQPPFPGQTRDQVIAQIMQKDPKAPHRFNRKIPGDLETICLKAIEKEPSRRYQTAEELALDLRNFVNGYAISARRLSPAGRLVKYARRHPAAAAFFGLLLVVVLAAGGIAYQLKENERRSQLAETQREVFVALLRGDFPTAERFQSKAIKLGASDWWRRFTRGHIELIQGDFEQATGHLRIALEEDPTSIAAKSLLAISELFAGDEGAYLRSMHELEDVSAKEFNDLLFLGLANTWIHPHRAVRLFDEVESQNSNYPLVRLWRSVAYRWCAMDSTNPQKALDYANRSIEDAKLARAMFKDNAQAVGEYLMANLVASNAYRNLARHDPNNQSKHLANAAYCANEARSSGAILEKFPEDFSAQYSLAILFQQTNDAERLRRFADKLKELEKVTPYVANIIGMEFFQLREYQTSLQWLKRAKGRHGELSQFFKYYVNMADPAQAKRRHIWRSQFIAHIREKLSSGDHTYLEFDWTLLILIGETDLADEVIAKAEQAPGSLFAPDMMYQYLQRKGSKDPEALLRISSGSRRHLSNAYFFLGIEALSQGDRERAMMNFNACLEQDYFHFFVYWLSRGLLAHMKHEQDWPNW